MRVKAFTAVLLSLLLGACALKSQDTSEPPTPLEPIEQTRSISRVWSVSLAGSGGVRVGLAPAVSGQEIIAAGYDGRVVAISIETGRVVWERRLQTTLAAGPGVGEGIVVVNTMDGRVIALSRDNGAERWSTRVSSVALGTPGITRGIVAVRTNDGSMTGLDAVSGDMLWNYSQSVPSLTIRGTSGVVAVGDVMVAGFDNGRVVGVQARDGQVVWEVPLGQSSGRTEVERMVDVVATPVALGSDVYAVAYQGQLAVLSSDSGRDLWVREMSSIAGLAVAASGLWVTDADSEIWSLSRLAGTQLWRQPALRARQTTAPAAGNGWVAVGDFEGWVHILGQEDGRFVARVRADRQGIISNPVAIGNVLVVQGSGGTLSAYIVGE